MTSSKRYGSVVVLSLPSDVNELARLAAAGAKMTIIEREGRQTRGGKAFSVDSRQSLGPAETVTDDDARESVRHIGRAIEIGSTRDPARYKGDPGGPDCHDSTSQ
jgi:hypothetical protein